MWNNSSSPYLNNGPNCNTSSVVLALSCSSWIFLALFILPLSITALTSGYQRWNLQHSFSNSDFFTYNLSVIHLVVVIGVVVFFVGVFGSYPKLMRGGNYLMDMIYPGELLIHSLTCVDRYLAVVHAINYMKFKQNIGVFICNISISIVWLSCFGYISVKHIYYPNYPRNLYNCIFIASLFVVIYCCVSVLCILTRPRPGDLDRVDQSKRRAFHTMVSITAVLLFWFVGTLITTVLEKTIQEPIQKCVLFYALSWCNVPSSVVLYVLLLHRNKKFRVNKK